MKFVIILFGIFNLTASTARADEIQQHIAKIESISAMNSGTSNADFSQKCSALLNYYESLVTKTYIQEGELSARTGAFKFMRSDQMKNFPFLKMSQENVQKEFELRQKCLFAFNNLYTDGFPPQFKTIYKSARVAVVTEKIGDNEFIIQELSVGLNPLARRKGQAVTKLDTRNSYIQLKSLRPLHENQQVHFFGIVVGSRSFKKQNRFSATVPVVQEIPSTAFDAFLLRGAVLEESLSQITGTKYICGLVRGYSKESSTHVLKFLCDRASSFNGDLHKTKNYQIYRLDE